MTRLIQSKGHIIRSKTAMEFKWKKQTVHLWRSKKEGQVGKKPCKMTRNVTDEDGRSWAESGCISRTISCKATMEKMTKFIKRLGNTRWVRRKRTLQSLVEQWYRWYRGIRWLLLLEEGHWQITLALSSKSTQNLTTSCSSTTTNSALTPANVLSNSSLPLVYYSLSQGLAHCTPEGFTQSITCFFKLC